MISLFVDTCTEYLILAIVKDNTVLDKYIAKEDKSISVVLLPKIKELLEKNKLNINSVNKIYCAVGPGSFTGIRIGVTVCKTLAYLLQCEVFGISSLEIMASSSNNDNILSYIDARRDMVYAGIYDSNLNEILKDQYISKENLKSYLSNNTICVTNKATIDNVNNIEINPNFVKIINKHKNDKPVNPHELNPIYLKLTEAEEKLNDKRS